MKSCTSAFCELLASRLHGQDSRTPAVDLQGSTVDTTIGPASIATATATASFLPIKHHCGTRAGIGHAGTSPIAHAAGSSSSRTMIPVLSFTSLVVHQFTGSLYVPVAIGSSAQECKRHMSPLQSLLSHICTADCRLEQAATARSRSR